MGGPMSRFFKSSALGAADPAGQPLPRYDQPQQWPNQDQAKSLTPLMGPSQLVIRTTT